MNNEASASVAKATFPAWDRLEPLGKALAVVPPLVCGFGYVASRSHYTSLDVPASAIDAPTYLSAGVLFAAMTGLAYLIARAFKEAVAPRPRSGAGRGKEASASVEAANTPQGAEPVSASPDPQGDIVAAAPLSGLAAKIRAGSLLIGRVAIVALLVSYFFWTLRHSGTWAALIYPAAAAVLLSMAEASTRIPAITTVKALYVVLIVSMLLVLFAEQTYPNVRTNLGGGMPLLVDRVTLPLSSSSAPGAWMLDVCETRTQRRRRPACRYAYRILQDDETVYVRIEDLPGACPKKASDLQLYTWNLPHSDGCSGDASADKVPLSSRIALSEGGHEAK